MHEKVEMSLDVLHVNEKLFSTSMSHETRHRTAIPTDGAEKKMIIKFANNMDQVYCKCRFHVVKLRCDKKIDPEVDE